MIILNIDYILDIVITLFLVGVLGLTILEMENHDSLKKKGSLEQATTEKTKKRNGQSVKYKLHLSTWAGRETSTGAEFLSRMESRGDCLWCIAMMLPSPDGGLTATEARE